MTVKLPFPGSSLNVKAADLGFVDGPDAKTKCDNLYTYGGGADQQGVVDLFLGDYSVPIYDASPKLADGSPNPYAPNTTVHVYQICSIRDAGYGFLNGISAGQEIPWNFNWLPGTANDRIMHVENLTLLNSSVVNIGLWMVYDPFYNAYDPFDFAPNGNCHNGLMNYWPWDLNANTKSTANKKIVVGSLRVSRHEYDSSWVMERDRGAGINGRAGIVTVDEILSGDIGHALELTITNTYFKNVATGDGLSGTDYLHPADRCEWHKGQMGRLFQDLNQAHLTLEGFRFIVDRTNAEIVSLYPNSTGMQTVARGARDYGLVVLETANFGMGIQTNGNAIANALKWKQAQITPGTNGFTTVPGLLDKSRMKQVKPTLFKM